MRKSNCNSCGHEFPMNQVFTMSGKVLCHSCVEKTLPDQDSNFSDSELVQQVDPTICVNCEKDNGTHEFSLLAGLPACNECIKFFKNRPFPCWIKVSFAGVVAFVVLSMVWNLRFIQAYKEMNHSLESLIQGDVETASMFMSSAAQRVPESADLKLLVHYTEGFRLMQNEQSAEALEEFRMCKNKLHADYDVDGLILRAECGVAFDSQDYEGFLKSSKALAERYPDDDASIAQVASAYACRFAISNDEQFKVQALDWLSKAQQLAGDGESFRNYENRIRYRLYSQEIISNDEFQGRFPNGWNNITEK